MSFSKRSRQQSTRRRLIRMRLNKYWATPRERMLAAGALNELRRSEEIDFAEVQERISWRLVGRYLSDKYVVYRSPIPQISARPATSGCRGWQCRFERHGLGS